jgi:hypothetical protein
MTISPISLPVALTLNVCSPVRKNSIERKKGVPG